MTKSMFALCGKIEHIISKEDVKDKTIKAVIKPIYTGFEIPITATRYDGTLNYITLPSIIATDYSRNDLILDLLKKEKDNYCLILSDRLEGLEYLHTQIGGLFIRGNMTSKKAKEERQQAIEKMRNKEEHFLFATYSLAKEGLDIRSLDRLFLVAPTKNEIVLIQSVGRIERKDNNKGTPIVYDFVDKGKYYFDAFQKRKFIYKKNGNELI